MTDLPVPYEEFKAGIDTTIGKLRTKLKDLMDGVQQGQHPMMQAINMHLIGVEIDLLKKQINTLGSAYSQLRETNAELVTQRDEITAQFNLIKAVLRENDEKTAEKTEDINKAKNPKAKKRRK